MKIQRRDGRMNLKRAVKNHKAQVILIFLVLTLGIAFIQGAMSAPFWYAIDDRTGSAIGVTFYRLFTGYISNYNLAISPYIKVGFSNVRGTITLFGVGMLIIGMSIGLGIKFLHDYFYYWRKE